MRVGGREGEGCGDEGKYMRGASVEEICSSSHLRVAQGLSGWVEPGARKEVDGCNQDAQGWGRKNLGRENERGVKERDRDGK